MPDRETVPATPTVDPTVAIEPQQPVAAPRRIGKAWLAASATAAAALVIIAAVMLRPDRVEPEARPRDTTSVVAPDPVPQVIPPAETAAPANDTSPVVQQVTPPSLTSPSLTPDSGPRDDEAKRNAATRSRTRTVTARANAIAANAASLSDFRRATSVLRDGDSLVSAGRFDAAASKFEEASRLFASAETAARTTSRPAPPVVIADPRPTSRDVPPPVIPTTRTTAPDPEPVPVRPVEERPQVRPSGAEDEIRETIDAYVGAQEALDADRYVRVFPSADRSRVAAAFRSFRSQDLDLTIDGIEVNGSRATVRAQETRTVQRVSADRTFSLERKGSTWVIVAIR